MWDFEPAKSAVLTRDFFIRQGVKNMLIPGIGYGRNAQLFRDSGMAVTGIELSRTAIAMARTHYGPTLNIHHGSVTGMPFDDRHYDGIFCYALIHLLDSGERAKLIRDCYRQLAENGYWCSPPFRKLRLRTAKAPALAPTGTSRCRARNSISTTRRPSARSLAGRDWSKPSK